MSISLDETTDLHGLAVIGKIDGREDEFFSLLSTSTEKEFCLTSLVCSHQEKHHRFEHVSFLFYYELLMIIVQKPNSTSLL